MKKEFSSHWKKSTQARKQRKYQANAPLHIKQKFISSHLSAALKKKYNTRSFELCKGDKVKLVRTQFKGKVGKVEKVDIKKSRVYITGIEILKKDGSKATYPLHPSNMIIEEFNLEDKKRREKINKLEKK